MTAAELIAQLQKLPPQAEVRICMQHVHDAFGNAESGIVGYDDREIVEIDEYPKFWVVWGR